ncbi:(R)-stereoselective amidase [Providencia rustigianii]|uniref:Hydrolase, carbon-nitrogen family n=2 Tax=Providencia rustigianii TaxID=158850 RepID=D1NXA0_9GAMM|nr:nitrilase-related carbon-nitrogen hydrolase [Providencia rustigianii]EFB74039.1 hydrolase, carbon-nitrogen family [Providencia rustigianii DSM 4541]MTC61683.1 hydrolase [Providencia rustigianii]SPY77025.1 (R)-stereoselective amidase [Providencia rustigianii]SUC26275.1 (R)-stereoselective amidase [Providencia rustigianii]SUC34969.1 (R)-stereoselective amidase [Providencia rustigianii]
MTDNRVKVALAQFDSELGNKQRNLQRMAQLCEQAAAQGAKLICFPELATTGYRGDLLSNKLWDLSDSEGSETYCLFSELASRLNLSIVAGFAERGSYLGEVYNSVGLWNPGCKTISGVFRKVHAFGIEKQWFKNGDSFPVFDTPIGKVGIMICYDMGFPEVARILTLQGAELLIAPSAWCVQDRDMWDINTACRALENGTHLLAVNRWGSEEDLHLFGGSKVLGPRGQVLCEATCDGEALLIGEVDFRLQAHTRLSVPYLRDRKPQRYGLLIQETQV